MANKEPYRGRALRSVTLSIFVGCLGAVATLDAQEQADADAYLDPALKQFATEIYYPSIPHLGGAKVEIWKTPSGQFVLKPYMVVDWRNLDEQLTEKCDGKDPSTATEITALIEFDSTPTRYQAVTLAKQAMAGVAGKAAQGLDNLNEASLRPFPFASLRVITGGRAGDDLPPVERRRLPDAEGVPAMTFVTGLNTSVIGAKEVPLRDTCEALRQIVDGKNMQGQAFITYDKQTITSVYASLSQIGRSEAFTDLIYDEKQTGEKKMLWSSKSGGWGFNVAGFHIGRQKSSGAAGVIDTRHRAVSNNVLTRAIAEAASNLTITTITPAGDKTPMPQDQVLSIVRTFVLEQAHSLRANFDQSGDGWELVTAYGRQPLEEADVDELIAVKTEREDKAGNDQEVEYEGVKTKDKRDQLQKLVNDVRWQKKGQDYIPVSVDLFELRAKDLDVNASMAWEDIVLTAGNGLMLVDLAVFDLDRPEYRAGFVEGQKSTQGPPKTVVSLPTNLHATWPPPQGSAPAPYLGSYYACDDPDSSRSKSAEVVSAGTKPTIEQFVNQIGCERATPNVGQACMKNAACRIYIRTPYCLTPNDWYIWFGTTAQRYGFDTFSGQATYCIDEQPLAIAGPFPGPQTMPR